MDTDSLSSHDSATALCEDYTGMGNLEMNDTETNGIQMSIDDFDTDVDNVTITLDLCSRHSSRRVSLDAENNCEFKQIIWAIIMYIYEECQYLIFGFIL